MDKFYQSRQSKAEKRYQILVDQLGHLPELQRSEKGTQKESNLFAKCVRGFKSISPETQDTSYLVTRERLKEAVLEYYRELQSLKDYRLLNRKALFKILKKFDKITGHNISPQYKTKIHQLPFDQSDSVMDTMDHTEVPKFLERADFRIYLPGTLKTAIAIMLPNAYAYEIKQSCTPAPYSTLVFTLVSPYHFW